MYTAGWNPMVGPNNLCMNRNPMMGLMMEMQMIKMMEVMMMMMGQQGGGGRPCCGDPMLNNPAFLMGMEMGMERAQEMNGCPSMPYEGRFPRQQYQMPFEGFRQPQFQNYCPRPHYGGPRFGCPEANPGAEVPNCGPNPDKGQIDQMLNAACQKYGVPPEIAKAVAYQESGWNPKASSFDGGHGKGIMQIDDRSHDFARGGQVWNPAANIDYGVKLLKTNFESSGDWHTAVRKYNGSGPAAENYANKVLGLAQSQPWQRWTSGTSVA